MYQINTTTKKFSEAVTIDIGQLPVIDAKIDFQLTDGSNPVIAENKTFAMTIGTVYGELYKTDEDTVSFRYLKFDDNNVANSLIITMTMDGVDILNDTVSLTYQGCGGGGSVQVDTEMNESSPNPVANSTLTQAINNKSDINHLHKGKYVPLNENGNVDGSYFVSGGWSTGGSLSSNGYVSAHLGFKKNNVDLDNIYAPIFHETTASSEATYQVSPNTPSVPVVTVSSALTLNASTVDSGSIAYSEIVLDVASGATVTAGNNITLVDTPKAGKRNICVVRWSGGTAKLYVTIVEDLPQA
jgi:hypothetical protein